MTTDDQVARLEWCEKRIRVMGVFGSISLILMVAFVSMGQGAPADGHIQAERFTLVDSEGNSRGGLRLHPNGFSEFWLSGAKDKAPVVRATASSVGGASLEVCAEAGWPRVRLAAKPDGTHAALSIEDAGRSPRCLLESLSDGSPRLCLMSGKPVNSAEIKVLPEEDVSFVLRGKDGEVLERLPR